MSSPTISPFFMPMLEEEGYLHRVLNIIDLFYVWWIIVLAIGLSAVLYRRKTKRIAPLIFAADVRLALAVGAILGS